MKWTSLLLLASFASCSTGTPLERGPVSTLLLRPRKGFQDKLTNQRCAEYKKHTHECIKFDQKVFDLNDVAVRTSLRALHFVCDVGGAKYGFCPNARGLCQLTTETTKFLGITTKTETKLNKYLSAHDDYQLLIDANTYCAAYDSDVGREMFAR